MGSDEKIAAVALDYIEGWYEGDPARMARALDPRLAKRRVLSKDEIWEIDRERLIKATQEGRGKVAHPAGARKVVTILDQTDTMASIRVDSEAFTDFFHLALVDGEWQIINALWDFPDKR